MNMTGGGQNVPERDRDCGSAAAGGDQLLPHADPASGSAPWEWSVIEFTDLPGASNQTVTTPSASVVIRIVSMFQASAFLVPSPLAGEG